QGVKPTPMKRGLHQFPLAAPEFPFTSHEAVSHEYPEDGIGAALLLIARVSVHQYQLCQFRRPNHRGLAQRRREPINVSVILEPVGNPAQRITPHVIGWPLEPMARRSHTWRQ